MRALNLLDYCQNDYFTGYHLPVLQIPVYNTMTCKEVAEELQEEFDFYYDMFENISDFENLLNSFCEDLRKQGDKIYVESEDIQEGEECAYLFFSITDIKQVNGINFLY